MVDARAALPPPPPPPPPAWVPLALPPPSGVRAGWYDDPGRPWQLRYFDGRAWTSHTAAPAAPPVPHTRLPVQVAIGAIVVLTASLVTGRLLLDHIVQYGWPVAAYAAINVAVGYGPSVWWCWYATGRWGSGDRRADLGLRFRWSDLGWGPVIWLSAMAAEIAVVALVTLLHVPLTSNTEGIREIDIDRTYVLALLITAVVAAPIVEEMIFRGLILRGFLSRMGPVAAIALQAAVFGTVHVDPARGMGNIGLAVVLAGTGAVFGGAAYLLRRLGPTMIAHALFNGLVMAIVLTR